MAKQNSGPERVFRLGNISASVFLQEHGRGRDKRTFHTVQVQRAYRDGDDTKYATNFTAGDLPAAIRCLTLAQAYVEQEESEAA